MNPNEIKLETVDKLFEYEKQSRLIDNLDFIELKNFAKLYCKLYLRQQEVIKNIAVNEI
jgi:hypothetical protein